jgi:hypothetical protein
MILKLVLSKLDGGGVVDWIHLAQIRDSWPALVKTLTDIRIRQIVGTFLSSSAATSFSILTQLHEFKLRKDIHSFLAHFPYFEKK